MTLEEELEMEFDEDLYTLPDDTSGSKSRILFSYGRTLTEEDWIKKNPSANTQQTIPAQYYDTKHALREPFKYMSARLTETNQALNDYLDGQVYAIKSRCRDLAEEYEAEDSTAKNFDEEEKEFRNIINDLSDDETLMGRLTEKTPVETYYVGRIRYGISKVGGRLDHKQVLLEASSTFNKGEIVPLDLSLLLQMNQTDEPDNSPPPPMSLFPGEVVLLKGQNPTGSAITVSRFIDLGAIFSRGDFPRKVPQALIENDQIEPSPLSIVCASGPFVSFEDSSAANLNLQDTAYMKGLAGYIKQYAPDYLLIFGPFLDAEQATLITEWTLIQNLSSNSNQMTINWTSDRLFNHQLRTLTKELEGRKDVHTQILFIPSSSEFPGGIGSETSLVFPTAPVAEKCRLSGVQYFSDPAMLSLGGVAVGATATDILRHMARNEISNISSNVEEETKGKEDRLHRLSAHILLHKHFYPLLPAETGINLECSQYDKLTMPITPHILILPSMLRPFVYNVQQTVVINPGKVNKNSIARILIDPVKDSSSFDGSIAQHVNVEVIKLIS